MAKPNSGNTISTDKTPDLEATEELRNAWDDFIGELQKARNAIDNPDLLPPPGTSRNIAEGYRYLAGFIHHGVERAFFEDPDFPHFRNALSMINKSTIENSDAIYFYAPIDGSKSYMIKAQVEDCRHWSGRPRKATGKVAPQYLIFELISGPLSGDTGDLAEMSSGVRTGFGNMDSADIQIGDDGSMEILLAPEKPPGYTGNYLCTHKPPSKKNPDGPERFATCVSGRQLFYDWSNEEPVQLTISPLDDYGNHPAPLTPADSAARLRKMGALIRGHMHFWSRFYDVVLNANGSYPADGGHYFMPVNAYNNVNAASSDTGGGMSTNIYAGGYFELEEDEALYIEARFTGKPVYVGFHLGNLWGESPDYANHQSSLNLHQMYIGNDGVQRWVVAHRDPGIQNWVDTTALPKGYLSHRWAYSKLPDKKDWPTISAKKIRFAEIAAHIPDDMPRLSPQERREVIKERQEHVQRRYRAF